MSVHTLSYCSRDPKDSTIDSTDEIQHAYLLYRKRANCCGLVEVDFVWDFLHAWGYFHNPEPETVEKTIDTFLLTDMYQTAWVVLTDHLKHNPFIEPFLKDMEKRGLIAKMFSTDYVMNENSGNHVRAFMVRFDYDAVKARFARRLPHLEIGWTLTAAEQAAEDEADRRREDDEDYDSLWS